MRSEGLALTSLEVANFWTISDNKWGHFCVTNDGTTLRAYANGVVSPTTVGPEQGLSARRSALCAHNMFLHPSQVGGGLTPYNSRSVNYIMKSPWTNDGLFHGRIDDLRIYDRALSDAEVTQIFNFAG